MPNRSVRAARTERTARLPSDDLIQHPIASLTHAITIGRPPRDVWPWLAQMGAGSRAGWYSYDFLDNGGRPSAPSIVPELQSLAAGMVFPALPGRSDAFTLLAFEPERFLTLGVRSSGGPLLMSWTFVLDPIEDHATRLIVRARGGPGYQFHRAPKWLTLSVVPLVHFVMQRRQLLNIARRAEHLGSPSALDAFIPHSDVRESFHATIKAPADVVMDVAAHIDLQGLPLARAIFRLREKLMRAEPPSTPRKPQGLLAETRDLGWGLLLERPGRLIVCGAACRPWLAETGFRSIPTERFASYAEPDEVKIAWTLEAEPLEPALTRFRHETRAVATDTKARTRFRAYWRWARFGIVSIRLLLLPAIRRRAERRWAAECVAREKGSASSGIVPPKRTG